MKMREVLVVSMLLLFNANLISQELVGTYNAQLSGSEFYDIITLNEDGCFTRKSGGSLGEDNYGYGKYIINESKLYLDYEEYYRPTSYYKRGLKKSLDILKYNLIITDSETGDFLKGANVFLENKREGFIADDLGVVQFTKPKDSNHFVVRITIVGYDPLIINFDPRYEENVEIFMQPRLNNGFPFEGNGVYLEIEELDNEIILTSNDNVNKDKKWKKIK